MNDQPEHPLIAFLSEKMTMTDVYQPAIVKDLLEHGGVRSKSDLAGTLAAYDTAKRDADQTDFRRTSKLVRDRIPDIIRDEGREPEIAVLSGKSLTKALYDKLVEEHVELLAAKDNADDRLGELVDMAEVILAMASRQGVDEAAFLEALHRKREERGGFECGYQLSSSFT